MKKILFSLVVLCALSFSAYAQVVKTFYIDFGLNDVTNGNVTASPDTNGNYWNNVTNTQVSATPVYLLTNRNTSSGAFLNITAVFSSNGINNGGLLSPDATLLKDLAINTATQDYFHTDNTASFTIKGLDVSKAYVFNFFGSRNDAEIRKSNYIVVGKTSYNATLQTSGANLGGTGYNGNNTTVLVTPSVVPDSKGQISVTVKRELGSFAYINVLKIEEVRVAAPALKTMYVDFGPNDITNGNITTSPDTNGSYWNNVTNTNTTAPNVNLIDKANASTGAYLKIISGFSSNGIQNGGLLSPSSALLGDVAINTATQDYFHTGTSSQISIRGLDKTKGYVFNLFGSRNDPEKRTTTYSLAGGNFYNGTLQTSGTDLGGTGYHGNTKTILTSDIIIPDDNGQISLTVNKAEGAFGYLNLLKLNQVTPVAFEPACVSKEVTRIAIMGSSVPSGTGATNNQGYAQLYAQLLTARATSGVGQTWNVSNISIPGNNTISVINRWDKDLLPVCSRYVVYALSLGNEGITTGGQAVFNQFRDNLQLLVNKSRQQGIEPIITNCYTREDYTAAEYTFIKQMNLLIHSWNVASVNLLGAIDNGAGRWATGYKSDDLHPNDAGHAEFTYAMVPSLFDALKAGKTQPYMVDGTSLSLSPSSGYKLEIKPEEVLHSFTFSYDIQTSSNGQVAEVFTNSGQNKLVINSSGKIDYTSVLSTGISGVTVINDNQWHKVTLTHYYAQGKTFLYVDKVLQGFIAEKIIPSTFNLNGPVAPLANYRKLMLHRAALCAEEVNAMVDNNLLKSSLEIYSPLDGAGILGTDPVVNLAQSTNKIAKVNIVSGTYYVQNRHSNLYLDVDNNQVMQDGCNIQQWSNLSATNQQFTFTPLTNGAYKIACVKSGKAMDVSGASTADGANVYQWGYVSGTNQQFVLVPATGGYYKIVAKHSGKLVEVSGFSTGNGGNVQQWMDANQLSGQWRLISTAAMRSGSIDKTRTEDSSEISLYPNPVNDALHIEGLKDGTYVEVYNNLGQRMLTAHGSEIPVGELTSGMYFLKLKLPGMIRTYKFIKQ